MAQARPHDSPAVDSPPVIRRVLVALSGSPYTESAIRHALELARGHEAELTGVTCVDLSARRVGSFPAGAGAHAVQLAQHRMDRLRRHVERSIERFQALAAEAGVAARLVREEGDAFSALVTQWHTHDLTIVGLRGLFDGGLVAEPADWLKDLLQRGVRPLVAVAEQPRRIERVLVAYDGSIQAAAAMKSFVRLRLWPDMRLRVVCFEPQRGTAEEILANAAGYCRAHGYEVETIHPGGRAREGLLHHAAEWDADLIVLGAAPRHPIVHYVLGDTALRSIREARRPLFLGM